ncbi:unnamed protein product, partial [marine sediment metagenome]
ATQVSANRIAIAFERESSSGVRSPFEIYHGSLQSNEAQEKSLFNQTPKQHMVK